MKISTTWLKSCYRFTSMALVAFLAFLASLAQAEPVALSLTPEIVAKGLKRPVGLAFLPDRRLLVLEQHLGQVRVIQDGVLREEPYVTVPGGVYRGHNESGLIGVCVDPQFKTNGFVYVFYTASPTSQRVVRVKDREGRGTDWTVLIDGLPAMGVNHNGGGLGFGPDGLLYVSVGENGRAPQEAQDVTSLRGQLLRSRPDGTIPPENPFPGSPVYCYGLRNTYRFAFHPESGRLIGSENGPNRNDEVNMLEKGKNYGWPIVMGKAGRSEFVDPIIAYSPCIAPTGITWYLGDAYPGLKGCVLLADMNDGQVHWLRLNADGSAVEQEGILYEGDPYGITDLAVGPDGWVYVTHFRGTVTRLRPPK